MIRTFRDNFMSIAAFAALVVTAPCLVWVVSKTQADERSNEYRHGLSMEDREAIKARQATVLEDLADLKARVAKLEASR